MLEASSATTSRDPSLTFKVSNQIQGEFDKHASTFVPGSPEDSRKDHVTRTGGPFEQDGGPFERDGGPFERAEVSSGGVFEEGGPFEDWRHEGKDGRSGNSLENQKTTAAPSSSPHFPHAIPDDVQFFEPNLVSIIIITIVIPTETVIVIIIVIIIFIIIARPKQPSA